MYYYVYCITNTLINKHYIGYRKSKCLPKEDLGIKYFSSSRNKQFIKLQKEHPEIFQYSIIEIFDNHEDALSLEIALHDKFNVAANENYYNMSKQTSKKFSTTGISLSESHKLKIGSAISGRTQTKEWVEKRINKITGKNNGMYGKNYLDLWIDRYGFEEAMHKYEKVLNDRVRGENNPCYNKYGKAHPASKSYILSNIAESKSEFFESYQDLIKRCDELGLKINTLRQYSAKDKSYKGYYVKSIK